MTAIFANITADSSITELLQYMTVCFILVCIVLSILSFATFLNGFFIRKLLKEESAKPKQHAHTAQPAAAKSASATVSDDNARITAILTAAVYAVLGDVPVRIVSITPSAPDFNWARSGRQAIYSSKSPKK